MDREMPLNGTVPTSVETGFAVASRLMVSVACTVLEPGTTTAGFALSTPESGAPISREPTAAAPCGTPAYCAWIDRLYTPLMKLVVSSALKVTVWRLVLGVSVKEFEVRPQHTPCPFWSVKVKTSCA